MIVVRFGEQVPHKPGLSSYLMYLLNQKSILMVDIKTIDIEIKKAENLKPKRCDCQCGQQPFDSAMSDSIEKDIVQ